MRVKCRRVHLICVVLALLTLFAATSTMLHTQHQKSMILLKNVHITQTKDFGSIAESIKKRAVENHLSRSSTTGSFSKIKLPKQLEQKQDSVRGLHNGDGGSKPNMSTSKVKTERKKQNMDKVVEKRKRAKLLVQEREKIEPNAASVTPNATFAGCLLIKDDNDILPEWLAYHYHTIGLRHLIVAVDPLSVEFPTKILKRWREFTDMNIQEWTDDNYMPSDFLVYQKPPEKYMEDASDFNKDLSAEDILEISTHRYRQRVFLAQCLKAHRDQGSSWVIHIDTDEYVVASKLLRQMNPNYVTIPPMDQPKSVLNLLQQVVNKTTQQVSYPCISMLRVLFGSVESSNEEVYNEVPSGFNAKHFESLRWRYHALPHNMSFHGNPKVILDVSAIPEEHFPEDIVFSIHRPVQAFCHRNKEVAFTNFRKQPIAVNHYLGSWERYAGRNDKRRSRAVYDAKANVRRGKDDGNRLWLKGFVRTFGFDLARNLLGDFYISDNFLQNQTLPLSQNAQS